MGDPAAVVPELSAVWGAVGPKASASRVPVHAAGLTGGMKRFFPLVDAPYGIPLNTFMPSTTTPRTFPADVSTMGFSRSAALTNFSHGATCAPASARPACFMNLRRLEIYSMFGSFAVARLSPKTTAPVRHFHHASPALLPVFVPSGGTRRVSGCDHTDAAGPPRPRL